MLRQIQRLKVLPRTTNGSVGQEGTFGVYFVDVEKGQNHRQAGSTSWMNDAEAELVCLLTLHPICCSFSLNSRASFHSQIKTTALKLIAEGFKESDIGIITPYQAQVQHIQKKISGHDGIRIGSVEMFQGDEKQIILISCVRTNGKFESLQFVLCPKRMNTAISRPRYAIAFVS